VAILTEHAITSGRVAVTIAQKEEGGSGEMDAPPARPGELHPALDPEAIAGELDELEAGDVDALIWHIDETDLQGMDLDVVQAHLNIAFGHIQGRGLAVESIERDEDLGEINVTLRRTDA
jgi:hypothetical protein